MGRNAQKRALQQKLAKPAGRAAAAVAPPVLTTRLRVTLEYDTARDEIVAMEFNPPAVDPLMVMRVAQRIETQTLAAVQGQLNQAIMQANAARPRAQANVSSKGVTRGAS